MLETAFSVEGRSVLSGAVYLNATGTWIAILTIEGDQAITEGKSVTIGFPDGVQVFNGTVDRSTSYGARTNVSIIGGKDGLGKSTVAQQYRDATVKVILTDLVRQGGETLSTRIDSSLLGKSFVTWSVLAKSVGDGIGVLANKLGVDWLVLDSGEVWLGIPTWTASTAKYELANHDTEHGYLELAPGEGSYSIRPGQSVDGHHVTAVTFRIIGSSHRIVLECS